VGGGGAGGFERLERGDGAVEDFGSRFDGGKYGSAGDSRHPVAAAAADAILTVGEEEFAFLNGDLAGGPEDLVADAVGNVIAPVLVLPDGAHQIGVETFVVGADDGVGVDPLAHLLGRVDSSWNDGVPVVRALDTETGQGQGSLGGRFLDGGAGDAGLAAVTTGQGEEHEDLQDGEKSFHGG
jgi:hypothetical protein